MKGIIICDYRLLGFYWSTQSNYNDLQNNLLNDLFGQNRKILFRAINDIIEI